ncbi:ribonuclease R [Mesoplasma lactucae]|uniref:Ribonuclease R n=1 Tax=Mesoplasma lactucae ATCC 49193 TaxID=81460 RepID=A0A291ISE5_9MOLU|nr:ribonuclease R [Mesoplasma lactucae]ATG97636.1 ribonuclease R [Mesoplasma lactucae ATCC 49193]ATZ19904.1 ribonuclease R [Mesoplasma lactucae ATCC 49193]MCL8216767.1 Ribonuclease R [Mesoplasma lactucae ATCC 49193]
METKIINLLKDQKNKKLNIKEISKSLSVKPDELLTKLKDMDEENVIAITPDMDVYLIDQNPYYKGQLKLHTKGFGFVSNLNDEEMEDYFVPPVSLNNALNDDIVVYHVEKDSFVKKDNKNKQEDADKQEPRYRAVVDVVSQRTKEYLVGEIRKSKDGRFLDFIPTDQSFSSFRVVMVNKRDFDLKENMIVKAKILRGEGRKLFVRISRIIGNALKAADRIIAIAEEFNIKIDFNKSTLEEAKVVAKKPDEQPEELKRREKTSIENRMMVTIDGVDSKDLDDSICVEKMDNGNYKLTVAIADVAHYVQPKSPLDNEALMRGNSTYLVNVVIPMLPEVLSNGVCSLNPNEKKFAMACEMEFDKNGVMLNKHVFETVMISKARLNYDQVNKFFKTGEINEDKQVADMLTVARELHKLLDAQSDKRGAIQFDIREPKIILDKDANVVKISSRATGESEKLIENFMVAANEAVAQTIYDKELPFIYRNHGKPDEEKLLEWYSTLTRFGIDPKLTPAQKEDPVYINKTLMEIEKQIKDPIEVELMNLSLLRYMDKAKYGLENIGHFGLASKCYTHFTSPIRRYSDLIVHRYLKQYLVEKDTAEWKLERNAAFVEKASTIINDTEQNSVDTEREVIKVCMVEYMQDKVGQIFDGVIVTALKFGTFVQLENMVEGLVHISEFPDGTYFDEKAQTLTTPQNKIYRMGDKVKVKLIKSDPQTRKIDFQFVQ